MHLDAEKEMMSQRVTLLGKFIAVREPNIRYLGLENMTRMLLVTDVQDIIRRHQAQIITSLKDSDIRKTSCYFADIFLQAESATATLNCSGVVLGTLPIRRLSSFRLSGSLSSDIQSLSELQTLYEIFRLLHFDLI
uniref:Uncharacterized protein n=1 Tax=Zea mays TaxID=4577 RepID=A0A804MJD3_MAIZE